MAIEIRILNGALAGQVRRFDQHVVVIGRQSGCDLRFDPEKDLDVSARHAEIHTIQGRYALHDLNSTNGTFVNGKRLESGGSMEVKPGDTIRFGIEGPESTFGLAGAVVPQSVPSTEVRIAMAVNKQTAGLRRLTIAGVALVVLGGLGALYYNTRAVSRRDATLRNLMAANDSMRVQLQASLGRSGDTTLAREVQRRVAELRTRLAQAGTDAERQQIRTELEETEQQLRRMVQMDLPTLFARNAGAVAIVMTDIDGKVFSGSAFGITSDGVLVTNRHNVQDPVTGKRATRLAVKFTNTRDWLPASILRVSTDPDEGGDLALIRMDRPATYPTVEAVSRSGADLVEGATVAVIGYPAGMDTPMEGEGNDFEARSTLSPGTVSKKTSRTLQIDSFATHGSSGSPVFNGRGEVVGVIYGGDANAGGKIVYAVTPERLAAFVGEQYRGILR